MNRITSRSLLLATALALSAGTVSAQEFTFGWNPRSGDVWVDTHLSDINRYGARYREPFIDELVRYHGAPRALVIDLLDRNWAPGDIYYACALASVIGRPCRYVVEDYERHHGEGWGATAKRLGIKPGSAEFHRLKRGFVPTYQRWGRPIRFDDAPHAGPAAPGKGKAQAPAARGNSDAHKGGHGAGHGKAAGGPGKGKPEGKGGKGGGKGKGKD